MIQFNSWAMLSMSHSQHMTWSLAVSAQYQIWLRSSRPQGGAAISSTLSCITELQSILNVVAWLVGGIPRCSHISSNMWEEGYLVTYAKHTEFKILMLLCNCVAAYAHILS